MTINLLGTMPFASGGNRLCYVHPDDQGRCIKVRRPDFTLADLRRKKGFPKNLRPLSYFDDNLEEFHVINGMAKRLGDEVFSVVSRCYRFEETNMGRGLVSELIRDGNGHISHSLKQYVYDHGHTSELKDAVAKFGSIWTRLGVPSRDLLVHNLVIQRDIHGSILRMVAIDGLGSPSPIPESWLSLKFRQARAARKMNNLLHRIDELLSACARQEPLGTLGILIHGGAQHTPGP